MITETLSVTQWPSTPSVFPRRGFPHPLEVGDRLTRDEFERRYEAMPHVKKAELIEGVVYMPSPMHHLSHGKPHATVMTLLGAYCFATPGVDIGDNSTVRLDPDNEVQPDGFLRIERGAKGQSQITEDDFIAGAPELVIEIAASSASYDLHDKLKVYRRNGVREYLIWRVYDVAFDWFVQENGKFQPLQPDEHGVIRSRVFPGLWLAIPALLRGDLAEVMAVLQRGVQSPEHAAFAAQITAAMQSGA